MAVKPESVTEKTFDTDVLQSATPVLVDFWATWCGPCKMIAPIVEQLAGEYEGQLRVMKLDVDESSSIAVRYSIMSIPTLGIFRGGELVERIVGFMPKEALKKRIDAVLS